MCGTMYALTVQAIPARLAQLFLKQHPSNICNRKEFPDIDSFVHTSIPPGGRNSSGMALTLTEFYSTCSAMIISCLYHSSYLLILSLLIKIQEQVLTLVIQVILSNLHL